MPQPSLLFLFREIFWVIENSEMLKEECRLRRHFYLDRLHLGRCPGKAGSLRLEEAACCGEHICAHMCVHVYVYVFIYALCVCYMHLHACILWPKDVYMKTGPVGEAEDVCCGWRRFWVQHPCEECEWYMKGVGTAMGRFQNCQLC